MEKGEGDGELMEGVHSILDSLKHTQQKDWGTEVLIWQKHTTISISTSTNTSTSISTSDNNGCLHTRSSGNVLDLIQNWVEEAPCWGL